MKTELILKEYELTLRPIPASVYKNSNIEFRQKINDNFIANSKFAPKKIAYSGGFRIPEDALKRRTMDLIENEHSSTFTNAKENLSMERNKILKDLEVKPEEELLRYTFNNKFNNKEK